MEQVGVCDRADVREGEAVFTIPVPKDSLPLDGELVELQTGLGRVQLQNRKPLKFFELIKEGVDVKPLLSALERNSYLWGQNGFRKNLQPHKEMSDIWVRYNDNSECLRTGDWSKFNDEHDGVWYPAYYKMPELRPLIFDLMRDVEGERLGGVLITRIPPGCGIAPHVDKGWHVQYYDKYYLSLKAAPGARFHHCSGEFIEPKAGDVWLFDNRLEHWVENKSNQDRITLIICIRSNRARD